MKTPKGSSHPYSRFCRWLFERYKGPWTQYFFAPVTLGLPPTFITTFYGNQAFKAVVAGFAPTVETALSTHVLPAIVFAFLYPAILLGFAKSVVKQVDSRGLNVDGLLALVQSIDEVVGCKGTRFAEYAKNPGKLTRETAFCTITQPLTQMAELARAICSLFNATRTSKNRNLIKVTMAVIENGQVTRIPIHYPQDEPVLASIEVLNGRNSSILTAYRNKKIVVIESIKNELQKPVSKRRFVDAGNDGDNTGSLICYPVLHSETDTIPYVISIHCDEDKYFKNQFSELYQHSLQRFALRLSLEHSLYLLKEKLCESAS